MKESILILEKDNQLTPYIEKTLESEYKIYIAHTNEMVSDFLLKYNLKLVIADHTFYNLFKQMPDFKCPVLILSDENKKDSVESKIYFTKKPFSFVSLLSKIKEILSVNKVDSSVLGIDTLSINTINRSVYRGSKLITLTKKEYTLLLFLLKHKDKAVSRSDLLENVWGMQIDPFSNTIEAHIFSLRKKIDRGHKIKLIHTIPKFGYRISEDK